MPTTQNSNAPTAISIQSGPDLTEDTVINAVNGLSAPIVPATITLNLNGGTYDDTTVSPSHNVTLIINGSDGTRSVLYVAFELGWSEWKVAFSTEPAEAPRLRALRARSLVALQNEIAKAKNRYFWGKELFSHIRGG